MCGQPQEKGLCRLYLRNCKVLEVDTSEGHWLEGVGMLCYGVTLI